MRDASAAADLRAGASALFVRAVSSAVLGCILTRCRLISALAVPCGATAVGWRGWLAGVLTFAMACVFTAAHCVWSNRMHRSASQLAGPEHSVSSAAFGFACLHA